MINSIGFKELLTSAEVDGTALTAAARASCIPAAAKFTLPANSFNRIGQQIMVEASGKISSVITTPGTARYDLAFGGTAIMDSLAILLDSVAAHTNVGWKLRMCGTLRSLGATASLQWDGEWVSEDILGVPATAPKGVLTAFLPWNTAPTTSATFDTTASQQVDLYFTQTAATGSMTLQQYSLWWVG